MTQSAEIVEHYRAKGLTGGKLTRALAKHARLLAPLDGGVSGELFDLQLRADGTQAHARENGWDPRVREEK